MSSDLVLDHVGIAVRDLGAARETFTRLGFAPTSLSIHSAPLTAGTAPVPTGSGNHCVMLRDGYVELIGLTDASKSSTTRALLERYEGAHILALGSGDVSATRERIAGSGLPIAQPVVLERDAAWGPGGHETRRASFANAHLGREVFPEARAFVIEHRTPDVVWQRHQLDHPNGAVALTETWIMAERPSEAADRYARLAGISSQHIGQDEWVVPLSRGRLRILSPRSAPRHTGEDWSGPHAAMAGIVIAVTAMEAAEALLRTNGIPFRKVDAGIRVSPAAAHGSAILFQEQI